jgi:hypothetical protein
VPKCKAPRVHTPRAQGYMWTKHTCNLGSRVFGMSRDTVEARWEARHELASQQVFDMIQQVSACHVNPNASSL